MQYKKHPIDRALEALAPILAPSFTLRSFRDKEGTVLKYPLIDYAIAGTTSKVYDASKNQWRSTYLVIFEILVQEKKVYDWCNYTELADAQDKHALFLAMEVIVEQLLVLLTNPSKIATQIRPLDTIYADLFFKIEGAFTSQYVSGHGKDLLTGVIANFEISCIDSEGGGCCLIDFNNTDQLQRLRDLMIYGTVSWNLLNQAGGNPPVTACDLIRAQLNDDLRNTCVLPQYNFTSTGTQNALSAQQILDLKNWLLPQYDFGDAYWQNLLTAQQDIDLTFYLLPLVDFTDPLIQAIITPQQQEDILNWLFPLLDFTNLATQALVTPQQQTDLQNWLCAPPQACFDFDGVNEYFNSVYDAAHELERTDRFTIFAWVKIDTYKISAICSKFENVVPRMGYYFRLLADGTIDFTLTNDNNTNGIKVTSVLPVSLNSWHFIVVTYDGSSLNTGFQVYKNGVLQAVTRQGTLTLSTVNAARTFKIGHNVAGGFFDGKIAVVGLIKGVTLNLTEVQDLQAVPYPKDTIYPVNQVVWADFGKTIWYSTAWVVENQAATIPSTGFQSVLIEYADKDFNDYPV